MESNKDPFPNPIDPLSTRQSDEPLMIRDTDLGFDSPHHTIGSGPTQAASGKRVLELERRVAMLEGAARLAGWTL